MNRRELLAYFLAEIGAHTGCRGDARFVQTVTGPVPASELGVTLIHEHVVADLRAPADREEGDYDVEDAERVVLPYLEPRDLLRVRCSRQHQDRARGRKGGGQAPSDLHDTPPVGVCFPLLGLYTLGRVRDDDPMAIFEEGDEVWVEQPDGSQRAAVYVGEAEASWFGGGPGVYVMYPDTRTGEEVAMMRVVPREAGATS